VTSGEISVSRHGSRSRKGRAPPVAAARLDMLHAIFAAPCLTTFCRLDELGLEAVGQRLEPDQAVIECRHPAAVTD
jgi:hypothetical protein